MHNLRYEELYCDCTTKNLRLAELVINWRLYGGSIGNILWNSRQFLHLMPVYIVEIRLQWNVIEVQCYCSCSLL